MTVFQLAKTGEDNILESVHRYLEIADGFDRDLFLHMILDVPNRGDDQEKKNKTIRAKYLGFFLGGSERLISLMNVSFPELGLKKEDCQEVSWIESVLYWGNFSINDNITSTQVLLNRTPSKLYHSKMKSDLSPEVYTKGRTKVDIQENGCTRSPLHVFLPLWWENE